MQNELEYHILSETEETAEIEGNSCLGNSLWKVNKVLQTEGDERL